MAAEFNVGGEAEAEPTFSWESAVKIQWTEGNDPQNQFALVKYHNGSPFFRLSKKWLRKVLTKELHNLPWADRQHAMARTDIVEQITELRDNAFKQKLADDGVKHSSSAGINRYTSKEVKGKCLTMQPVVHINAPTVGRVAGIQIQVMVSKPTTPLYVALSDKNLIYLTNVVKVQFEGGSIHRQHARDKVDDPVDTGEVGVHYLYAKQEVRVVLPAANGKKTTTIPTKQLGIWEALQLAKRVKHDPDFDVKAEMQSGCKDEPADTETER